MTKKLIIGAVVVVALLIGLGAAANFYWKNLRGVGPALSPVPKPPEEGNDLEDVPLTLPSGFSIGVFAKGLGGARVIAKDEKGTLLVSVPSAGKVLALPDGNPRTVVSGLKNPHGLAFRKEGNATKLYIAEEHAVSIYEYDPNAFTATNRKKIVDLPSGDGHYTRTILIKDDKLFISVGSSCNVCHEEDNRRAKILVANPDGSDVKEYARGLRNAVFMASHPNTEELWVTEMARDLLGDDIPPDEINIVKEGGNYGWPNCYGKNIHDSKFDKNTYIRNPCMEPFEKESHVDLQAHSAPLGLAFIPPYWPQEYQSDLLVAFHGSWNRSVPTGYKIVRLKFDGKGAFQGQEDFISGWLNAKNQALGRPVDLFFDQDGTLFVSDDKAGVIYRVTIKK